ncbi:NifB/NifX family molybdenum-iron cluster-binding protein [Desulfobotulus sp. H1]|uniref:NifB/NifX family molybdenum-iron cluster-binding protein n=1 Tax=Desulfobotulus pelophilus TaxID=2823377 RepID=A0ABT3NB23_9BACT|nr:NifB/NifX family molybdenum-iron cluster-binding protein [Desulfobotulus pelophilus]MCW7754366.1 NifB/NifX family molybdenum-iron cluster-binding protein [Desulfobotulus pelophilus]
MKIALPTKEDSTIDSHFGHCEYFTVFTLNENREIVLEEKVASPVGCGCKSNIAETLAGLGVTIMLAGNMGDGAVRVLQSNGIEVLRGCMGKVRDVADKWLAGKLMDSGMGCMIHGHECQHGE